MKYYIQHTQNYAFDYILWWRPDSNGNGYTYDIDQAGLYDEEEARRICNIRGEEAAWPEDSVQQSVTRAVVVGHLRKLTKPKFDNTEYRKRIKAMLKPKRPPPPNCASCGRFFRSDNPYDEKCRSCEVGDDLDSRRHPSRVGMLRRRHY